MYEINHIAIHQSESVCWFDAVGNEATAQSIHNQGSSSDIAYIS